MAFWGWPAGLTWPEEEECSNDLITVVIDSCQHGTQDIQTFRKGCASPPSTPAGPSTTQLLFRPSDLARLRRKLIQIEQQVQKRQQYAARDSLGSESTRSQPKLITLPVGHPQSGEHSTVVSRLSTAHATKAISQTLAQNKLSSLPSSPTTPHQITWDHPSTPDHLHTDTDSQDGLANHTSWWAEGPLHPAATSTPAHTGAHALCRNSQSVLFTRQSHLRHTDASNSTPVHSYAATWDSTESTSDSSTRHAPSTALQTYPGASTSADSSPANRHAAGQPGPSRHVLHSPRSSVSGQGSAGSEGSSTTEDSVQQGVDSSIDSDHKQWRRRQQLLLSRRSGSLLHRHHATGLRHTPSAADVAACSAHSAPLVQPWDIMRRVASLPVLSSLLTAAGVTSLQTPGSVTPACVSQTCTPRATQTRAAAVLTEDWLLASRVSVRETLRGPRMQRWLLDAVSMARPAPEPANSRFLWGPQLRQLSRSFKRSCRRAWLRAGAGIAHVHASAQWFGTSSLGTIRAVCSRLVFTIGGGCVARRKAVELVDRTQQGKRSKRVSLGRDPVRPVSAATREAAARQLAAMEQAAATAAGQRGAGRRPPLWTDSSEDDSDSDSEMTGTSSSMSSAPHAPAAFARPTALGVAALRHSSSLPLPRTQPLHAELPLTLQRASLQGSSAGVMAVSMSGIVGRPASVQPDDTSFSAVSLDTTQLSRLTHPPWLGTPDHHVARSLRHVLHDGQRMRVISFTLPAGYRLSGLRSYPWSATLHVMRGSVTVVLSQADKPSQSQASSRRASLTSAVTATAAPVAVTTPDCGAHESCTHQAASTADLTANACNCGQGAARAQSAPAPPPPQEDSTAGSMMCAASESCAWTALQAGTHAGLSATACSTGVPFGDQQGIARSPGVQDVAASAEPVAEDVAASAEPVAEDVAASAEPVAEDVAEALVHTLRLQEGSVVSVGRSVRVALNSNTFTPAVVTFIVHKV